MEFNINTDLINNDKILVIAGKSSVGKSKLLLKIAKNLNYDTIYIDVDNCINKSMITNKNINIIHIYNFDNLVKFLHEIKEKCNKNTIIIIDQFTNIRDSIYNSKLNKEFSNLMNLLIAIQKTTKIKFILSCAIYRNVFTNKDEIFRYMNNKFVNIITIESYDDVINLDIKKQIREYKLKEILC